MQVTLVSRARLTSCIRGWLVSLPTMPSPRTRAVLGLERPHTRAAVPGDASGQPRRVGGQPEVAAKYRREGLGAVTAVMHSRGWSMWRVCRHKLSSMVDYDWSSESLRGRLRELMPSGAGSVGGALVGLAIGGPAGAVVGAATEPALEQLVSAALALRRRRGERAYEVAADEAGMSPDELLRSILGDERLLDLAVAVVTAAAETALDAKINALGRALATGATAADDAVVDEQRLLVRILADLEAPHIRVLVQLARPHPRGRSVEVPRVGGETRPGWAVDDLEEALASARAILEPILRVLEAHGLATEVASAVGAAYNACSVTDAGLACLTLLGRRAEQPPPQARTKSGRL